MSATEHVGQRRAAASRSERPGAGSWMAAIGFVAATWLGAGTAHAAVDLILENCGTVDNCAFGGTPDAQLEPGETGSMRLTLRNRGSSNATNVTATVSCNFPGITFGNDTAAFGTILARSTGIGTPNIDINVDPSVPCGTVLTFDIAIFSDQQTTTTTCILTVPDPCQICAPPFSPILRLDSCATTDRCAFGLGDMNGSVEPGETGRMTLVVTNIGSGNATNVGANVTTGTAGVLMTNGTVVFGTIAVGRQVTAPDTIDFTVDASVPCGTVIHFNIAFMTDQGNFNSACDVTVPDPCITCSRTAVLRVLDCAVVDDCVLGGAGDGNGIIEPGETGQVTLRIENAGLADATSVTAVVTSTSRDVTITQPNATFGAIASGANVAGTPTIDVSVPLTATCGTSIQLDVAISSDQGPFSSSCTLTIPTPCTRCEPTPSLSLESCATTDDCSLGGAGDGNGEIDPGETGDLGIVFRNSGTGDATNVQGTVTSPLSWVNIITPNISFGTIAAGASVASLAPAQYSLDATAPCGATILFNIDLTSDQGPASAQCTSIAVASPCTPCSPNPVLSVASCAAVDDCALGGPGDGDGNVDPGETAQVTIDAQNLGAANATTVTATVTTATPGVTITGGASQTFGTIASGATVSGTPAVSIDVASSVPCGTVIRLDVAFASDQGAFSSFCTITVPAGCRPCNAVNPPQLGVLSCTSTDDCAAGGPGDGNGQVEPGETATMVVRIENTGTGGATGVTATVTTATAGIAITSGSSTFGAIAPGGSAAGAATIDYSVATSVPCGTTIVFDIAIASNEGPFSDTCSVSVPVPCAVCSATTPPQEVPYMIVRKPAPTGPVQVDWTAAPGATTYNVYKGSIDTFTDGVAPDYDHGCAVSGVAGLTTTVASSTSGDGLDNYYLVVGANSLGEGPYGFADHDHDGVGETPRPPGSPLCP